MMDAPRACSAQRAPEDDIEGPNPRNGGEP
ncbi:hypothetical protein CIB50_0000551 [Kocuria varians]|uniref:Uncharacterized protein n=1 Tax=Kocuria varians TaxID=1272 RepID=A0A7D7PR08_KOCVA|nr:hypothetical protein CIB50_0000551 [Kocuria varians]